MNSSSETTDSAEVKEAVEEVAREVAEVSGTRANRTGGSFEQFVENALKQRGYVGFGDHKEQVFANRASIEGKQFAKQVVIGTTIYGTKRRCDFLVLNREKFPDGLVIECKWQESGGSVDEKYPFLLFNIAKIGVPTVVLLDGGGYKPMAMEWLKSQADPKHALIAVWNMTEFHREVNKGFLG
jgi:hypothetical protein